MPDMHNSTLALDLQNLLKAEHAAMKKLYYILDQETSLLASGNELEELGQVTTEKDRLVEELKLLASQRAQLSHTSDPLAADTDFESFLNTLSESATLLPLWHQLLSLTARCQEVNQMNGAIIKGSEQQLRQAICLLRSENPVNVNYTETGDTTAAQQCRFLGQA